MVHRDRLRHAAGQHRLEMAPGEGVLSLEVEGAGELEADADQAGIRNQHLAEGGDRLVEKRVAAVFVRGRGGGLDGGHPLAKQGFKVVPVLSLC